MPEELLERIQAELRERVERNRRAVEGYRRLERALAALDAVQTSDSARPREEARSIGRGGGSGHARRRRAPRGRNRARVLAVVAERPGVSAAELAQASGVQKDVLYGLLGRLVRPGELQKEELPGGVRGYVLAEGSRTEDSVR
jgi:hypothetical protein